MITTEPTLEPTIEPTMEPTTHPVIQPTIEPTHDPVTEPTMEPTFQPTIDPISTTIEESEIIQTLVINVSASNLTISEILKVVISALNITGDQIVSTTINQDGSVTIIVELSVEIDVDDDILEGRIEEGIFNEYGQNIDVDVESSDIMTDSDDNLLTFFIVCIAAGIVAVFVCVAVIWQRMRRLRETKGRTHKHIETSSTFERKIELGTTIMDDQITPGTPGSPSTPGDVVYKAPMETNDEEPDDEDSDDEDGSIDVLYKTAVETNDGNPNDQDGKMDVVYTKVIESGDKEIKDQDERMEFVHVRIKSEKDGVKGVMDTAGGNYSKVSNDELTKQTNKTDEDNDMIVTKEDTPYI